MHKFDNSFWEAIDTLVNQSEIIIDRPKGTVHPKYPNFIYKSPISRIFQRIV